MSSECWIEVRFFRSFSNFFDIVLSLSWFVRKLKSLFQFKVPHRFYYLNLDELVVGDRVQVFTDLVIFLLEGLFWICEDYWLFFMISFVYFAEMRKEFVILSPQFLCLTWSLLTVQMLRCINLWLEKPAVCFILDYFFLWVLYI